MSLQKRLINYCYFSCTNGVLAFLISIGYFFSDFRNPRHLFTISNDIYSIIFFITAHFSSIMLLSFIFGLMILPCILSSHKYYKYTIALIFTFGISLLCLDIISNYFFSFNVNDTMKILYLLYFPTEFSIKYKIVILSLLFILFAIEVFLIKIIEKLTSKNYKPFYTMFVFITICSFVSYGIYYSILNKNQQQLIISSQTMPWFYKSSKFMHKMYIPEQKNIITNIKDIIFNKQPEINYPINSLNTCHVNKPPNILVIGIDCWRADYFNAVNTPNLWQFAKQGKIFTNHQSAGNCTRLGLFGLFYGIPATHWRNFFIKKKSSVLMDRLQQLNYSFNAFSYSPSNIYYMDHLFLNNIKGIEYSTKGCTPAEIDNNITADWLSWYKNRDTTKPYFSFIWYGSVYGNDFPQEYAKKFKRTKYFPTSGSYRYHDLVKQFGKDAFIATYKTAVNYIDDLASEIINELKQANDLSNTVIIITSDHGQDFAENRQGFWGHGTNFTDGQIKVPFAIIHPVFNQEKIIEQDNLLTTHYDLVPTLMKNFLGINNNISDYSVGVDLLAENTKQKCDFVTGNFKWCGIANSDYIINFHPSGNYYITDKQNQPLFNRKINKQRLYEALYMMTRFLK